MDVTYHVPLSLEFSREEYGLLFSPSVMSDSQSAALNMPASLENSAMATGLEMVSFHSNE